MFSRKNTSTSKLSAFHAGGAPGAGSGRMRRPDPRAPRPPRCRAGRKAPANRAGNFDRRRAPSRYVRR